MPILKVKDNGEWKEIGEGSLIDSTLTVAGASADAKATGDKINELGEAVGVSNSAIESLEQEVTVHASNKSNPHSVTAAQVGAVSANGQSNELYSSIETGWLARINTNDGTNTTTVGADETGGIYAYKNGELVWRIPSNVGSQTNWNCPTAVGGWSRVCRLVGYSNGLLTLHFSQSNQAVMHTYFIGTSWGHATLTQIGSSGFSNYYNQQVRIVQNTSTEFYIEVYNDFEYNGASTFTIGCSYTSFGSNMCVPYTALTAAGDNPNIKASLTSKNDGITATKFYGELVGTVSNAIAKSGDTMTGALNFANGTWNFMGDDAYIGDCNEAGCIGIKGANGTTGLNFVDYNGGADGKLTWDGAAFKANGRIYSSGSSGENQIGVDHNTGALYMFGNGVDRGVYDSGLGNYIFNTTGGTPHFYGNANYANTSGWANGADKANELGATYTGSGGAVGPNHTGAYTVKCHMMNQLKGTDVWFSGTGYADVLMMNAYEWADVPYATALAIAKTNGTPRAWIASGGNTDNWAGATELITANNIGGYAAPSSHTHSLERINITPSSNCSNASGLAKYYPDLKMVVFFTCLTTQVAMTQQIYHVGSIPEQYVPNARFALSAYANKSTLAPSESSGRTAGVVSISGFIYDDGNIYVDLGADLPSGSYIWLSGTWCTA